MWHLSQRKVQVFCGWSARKSQQFWCGLTPGCMIHHDTAREREREREVVLMQIEIVSRQIKIKVCAGFGWDPRTQGAWIHGCASSTIPQWASVSGRNVPRNFLTVWSVPFKHCDVCLKTLDTHPGILRAKSVRDDFLTIKHSRQYDCVYFPNLPV